jgi:RimJ/RimL family protein N-acetyltransferase
MISEESFIDFQCPHCGGTVSFPQTDTGLARACVNCLEDLVVPETQGAIGRKLPLPVTTPRLTLRRLVAADWKDLLECSPGEDEESILHWLERESQVRLTTPEQPFSLGVELREGGKLAGYLSLRFTDASRTQAELKTVLNEHYQQTGLTVEAIEALLGFCFEGIKLHRVTAMCDSEDQAGRKLFESVGLRQEAEFIKNRWDGEAWRTSLWYATLAEEYLAEAQAPRQP